MKRSLLPLALLSCSVSAEEAKQFADGIAVVSTVEDPGQVDRMLFTLCYESKGCADGCSELELCATGDPNNRPILIASCFSEYEAVCQKQGRCEDPSRWIRGRVKWFADQARSTVPDPTALDAAVAKLQL